MYRKSAAGTPDFQAPCVGNALTPTSHTPRVACMQLSEAVGDFPVVHPGKASRKARYTWIALIDKSPLPQITGIHKVRHACMGGVHACMCGVCAAWSENRMHYTWVAHIDKSPLPQITGIHKASLAWAACVHACMGVWCVFAAWSA